MRKIIPQKFYYVIAPRVLTGFSCRTPENNSKIIFPACVRFDSQGRHPDQQLHLRHRRSHQTLQLCHRHLDHQLHLRPRRLHRHLRLQHQHQGQQLSSQHQPLDHHLRPRHQTLHCLHPQHRQFIVCFRHHCHHFLLLCHRFHHIIQHHINNNIT